MLVRRSALAGIVVTVEMLIHFAAAEVTGPDDVDEELVATDDVTGGDDVGEDTGEDDPEENTLSEDELELLSIVVEGAAEQGVVGEAVTQEHTACLRKPARLLHQCHN